MVHKLKPFSFIYADAKGNIAHFVTGRIPVRSHSKAGTRPARGWLNEDSWVRMMTWKEMPRVRNPPEGFILSCNHKLSNEFYPTANTWSQGYRALRLTQLIESFINNGTKITLEDAITFQQDTKSLAAEEFHRRFFLRKIISKSICPRAPVSEDEKLLCAALEEFRRWDSHVAKNSAGAAIYHAVYQTALIELFNGICGSLRDICLGK